MTNKDSQLKALIRLALKDEHFAEVERSMIFKIAEINRVPQEDVDALIKEELSRTGGNATIEFSILTYEERFEYLYNLVQLMKSDHKIFLSEIKFCQEIAAKLKFSKEAVEHLSKKVFADPSITSDREALKDELRKFDMA